LKNTKKIFSVLLLLLFLSPTVIRDFHHHEHFICHAKNEKHIHDHHPDCKICKFEFSVFKQDFYKTGFDKISFSDSYLTFYKVPHVISTGVLSFSLRAPPLC